jgi:Vps53-like, N-terminal
MAALLSKAGKDLTVTVLLDTLQQTKDFELSMGKKFGAPVSLALVIHEDIISSTCQLQDILQETSPTPARPLQSISSCFEPHMGVYVQHQDKWVFPSAVQNPRVLICALEQLLTSLLPIGDQRRGHHWTRTNVIPLRTTRSKPLLSFYLPRRNCSMSMGRHSRVARRCQLVSLYSTC